ncbi:sialidase family protein [Verrucomicrobiota bacterium]
MKVQERGTVAWRPGQMYGWPGLTRAVNGDLLVVASERKHHCCPYGRVVVMRSGDNGHTWSLPMEIYNSEIDDRDGTLATLPDGTVVAGWFTSMAFMQPFAERPEWAARSRRVTKKMQRELVGSWILRSRDHGQSWELTATAAPDGGCAHIGPFALSGGALVCFGSVTEEDGSRLFYFRSDDKGETWSRLGEVPCERVERGGGRLVPYNNERALLELGGDRLLVLFRNEKEGHLQQSESRDGGRTWAETWNTPIRGFPPHLLRLSDGRILCSYGHRFDPWSIRVVVSEDDGRTWDVDHLLTLDKWDDKPDMGYPVSIETGPGEVLSVYYVSRVPITHLPEWEKTFLHGSTPEGIVFCRFQL